MKKIYGVIWFILVSAWLFFEGLAVGNPSTGDTFTEWVRQALAYWPVEAAGFVLWIWTGYHFFLELRLRRKKSATQLPYDPDSEGHSEQNAHNRPQ
jgi:hypothetical protein